MTLDKPIYYPEVVFSNSNIPNFMSSIFKQDRYNVTSHYDPDLYGWEPRFYSYRDMKLGRIPKQYVWPKDMSKFKKVHVKKEKEFPKIAALNGLPSPERYKPDNKRSFDNYMPAFSIAGATPCTEPTTPPPLIPPGVSIEDSAGHWHIFTISGDGAVKTYLGLDGTCPRWNPAVTEIFYNHNTVVTPAGAFLRNLVVSAPQHHSRISLDGLKVLYLCNGNIWVTNYDGSGGNVQRGFGCHGLGFKSFGDVLLHRFGQVALFLDDLFHKIAVAVFGGDSSGGFMGRGNISQFLKRRHLIADGGRTHAQFGAFHHVFGTHRFRILGVSADNQGQDFFLPAGKFRETPLVCSHSDLWIIHLHRRAFIV